MERASMCAAVLVAGLGLTGVAAAQSGIPTPDLTQEPTLYLVGYSHLDTQWRWTYPQTIREMIPATMRDNFRLLDLYPHYLFNFSGSNRYRMMREYYPADYEKVKQYVAAGRWFPAGSSVEECDVMAIGAESVIRQVLYGNHYFRREFGQASAEFMLPDCFGFPASLPSLLAHCGLKGFSTQKLSHYNSAVGIPFNVGIWEGLDGTSVIAALNAFDYAGSITEDLSHSAVWLARIRGNGEKSGVYADFRFYGTGDKGGAPKEDSVRWVERSVAGDGPVRVIPCTAERMFLDLPADKLSDLPRYTGDLLLVEHSAGSITSGAYIKRQNFKNELLADAAERAAVLAEWIGGPPYPRARLNDAWTLVMGGQFHDILPGTSHPQAYEYSWNDEFIAQNQFADVLAGAAGAVAAALDTQAQGVPIVVYNPLSIERQDVVEATVSFSGAPPKHVRVFGPDGAETPAQIIAADANTLRVLFLATVPSVGWAVYDVQPAEAATPAATPLKVSDSTIENARYRVTLDANGDVSGIFDKAVGRELLSGPARLVFLRDKPSASPAWNMDWGDRQRPPLAFVAGPTALRVTESGPVRVAIETVRESRGSRFVQTIRLAAGAAGDRVEFANTIDWQSRDCCLKAVFPLTVANPRATYNWEVGTIARDNNNPRKFEVPARQWFNLTAAEGGYGVTVLSDCKYGSDKPDDRTLRLTLLRAPGVSTDLQDQLTLDWGRHEILYGLAGHAGDWRGGQTDWHAMRLSQPLIAFQTAAHGGLLGRSFALLKVSSSRVRVMALKKAEDSDELIVRLVELDGRPAESVRVALPAPIAAAREINGQEQPLAAATVANGELVTDVGAYRLRSFALQLGSPPARLPPPQQAAVQLTHDRCVTSRDNQPSDGGFDAEGRCLPAEMLPSEIAYRGVVFGLGPADGRPNALACRGQEIALPQGAFNRLYLLAAAADGDRQAKFRVDARAADLTIQDWGGYIGQWDNRIWDGVVAESTFDWPNELVGLSPAYVQPAPIAWFCSHRHSAAGENEEYSYCYLFAYAVDLPAGAKTLTLPTDDGVLVLAATVAADVAADTRPAQSLLDDLRRDARLLPTILPAGGQFTDTTYVTLGRPLFGGDCAIHYTLDGSEPTRASPQYDAPFALTQDTVVKARLFERRGPAGEAMACRFAIRDTTPPVVRSIVAFDLISEVRVEFSEPLERTSAENPSNYKFSGSLGVAAARLSPNGQTVTLSLAGAIAGTQPVLTLHNLRDRSPAGNVAVFADFPIAWLRPVATVDATTLDGTGGGAVELPLGPDAPTSRTAPWTINLWLWVDEQPADYAVIAGFGTAQEESGAQRFLTKFPHGLHFWASNVDVPADAAIDVQRWQMLTATYDGRTLCLFKDGRQSASQCFDLEDATPLVRIGPPPPWPAGRRLAGRIAGFALWNQALPGRAVAELHKQVPPETTR